jgi:DNA end-binding protein Ku
VVTHRRERLLMLQPRGKGIVATALRYKKEVRAEDTYFNEIPAVKVPRDMLDLAEHILEQKRGHFDPDKFEDRYETAFNALIKAKRAGKAPPVLAEPRPSNVINLMDALRRSAQGDRRRPASRRRNGNHRKRPAARRKVRRAS